MTRDADGRSRTYTAFWIYVRELDGSVHVEPTEMLLKLRSIGKRIAGFFKPGRYL